MGKLTHYQTFSDVDFAYAGTGGMRGNGNGSITLGGVTGTIKAAFLIWQGPTNSTNPAANATVTFAGTSITGQNMGFGSPLCWPFTNSQAYAADVSSLVTGNGSYSLTGFLKGDADINGATLVVIYDDGDSTNNKDVTLFVGNDGNIGDVSDDEGWSASLNGIAYSGTGSVEMILTVADGQAFGANDDGTHSLNGTAFAADVFDGNAGAYWDNAAFDITGSAQSGLNNFLLEHETGNDCLGLVMAIIAVPAAAPTANDDSAMTTESTTLEDDVFEDNGGGPDTGATAVTEVNGDSTKVGQQIALASGALLTVNGDGTYSYDPNGAFDYLVSPATAAATGAVNGSATDSFTYTINGGDTATVTITITGEDDRGDRLMGDGGDNDMSGTANADIFDLRQGGADEASGAGGRDAFYFGAAFAPGDQVDGGGNADIVILQGDYSAGTSLEGIANLGNLGSISLFSHANALYGGQDGTPNSYDLTAADSNVGAGEILKINGSSLAAGEDLTFDGSAESDGSFWIYGGKGTDTLTGGAKNDTFIFGVDGRLTAGDSIEGGGGYDLMILRGDYVLNLLDPDYVGMISGIESIALISAADNTYATGGDGEFDYVILWGDENLAAGVTLTVNGSRLGATETMYFDGGAETGGHFRLWGGAADDFLAGGGGNDLIYGGLGADSLIGGGGADTFRYQATAESTAAAADMITGFQAGIDKIDLSRIDANVHAEGDQAFRWVGLTAFSGQGAGSAGELRMVAGSAGEWRIEGDTNGDGIADLVIDFNGTPIITFGDFIP